MSVSIACRQCLGRAGSDRRVRKVLTLEGAAEHLWILDRQERLYLLGQNSKDDVPILSALLNKPSTSELML